MPTNSKKALLPLIAVTLAVVFVLFPLETQAYAAYQPSSWASPKLALAEKAGLLPKGFSERQYTEPITRRDFCELLVNGYSLYDYPLPKVRRTHPFSDTQDKAVEQAYFLGLTSGTAPGIFSPQLPLTREMAVVMLGKLHGLLDPDYEVLDEKQAEQILRQVKDGAQVSPWARRYLADAYFRGIIAGTGQGLLDPQGKLTREQGVILTLNLLAYCDDSFLQELAFKDRRSNSDLADRSQAGASKVDWSQISFASESEALAYMVEVEVPVWQLVNGSKKPGTLTFKIHRAVADDVRKIFTEIYHGEEQFPIKSIIGFSWRGGTSQHNLGLAIDINPEENYFIGRDGTIKTGKLWLPGENPYSILPEGDVVRAFNKYGWHWSPDMNWSNGADYMHFSLSGT